MDTVTARGMATGMGMGMTTGMHTITTAAAVTDRDTRTVKAAVPVATVDKRTIKTTTERGHGAGDIPAMTPAERGVLSHE